ncbi:unnamed protein product [Aureobasidium pullulans]|nr:unnamed protein product [Aureobasidium pullulans]
MSSIESPPSYPGEVFFNEKCPKSTAYHFTLERCRECVKLESGRYASTGILDELNIAITIPSHHTWPQVREQVWSRFQSGWPAILGKADLEDFAMGINMQYLAQDGRIRGRVELLTSDEDGLWDLCRRGGINVVRFRAHCAPREGVAAGQIKGKCDSWFEEVTREDLVEDIRGKSTKKGMDKGKGKSSVKHRCILQ